MQPRHCAARHGSLLQFQLISRATPIGGQWDWDKDVFGFKAGLSVVSPNALQIQLQDIDKSWDDGNLVTGHFQDKSNAATARSWNSDIRARSRYFFINSSTALVIAITPVRMVGSGTGANLLECKLGSDCPVFLLSASFAGSTPPIQKLHAGTE